MQVSANALKLTVVACTLADDAMTGTVVLACPDPQLGRQNLTTSQAKRLAIQTATQHGMHGPSIGSLNISPYPVDQHGKVLENTGAKPHAWYADFPLRGRL